MTDTTSEPQEGTDLPGNRHVHPDPPPTYEVAERRRRAVMAGHTSDLDTARSLAADPSSVVRSAALGALARIGRTPLALSAEELATQLAIGLMDSDPAVRRRAIEILGDPMINADEVVGVAAKQLPTLLTDPDPTVVEMACWAAGENPDLAEVFIDPVVAVAGTGPSNPGHEDPLCREAAVAALGALGHVSGLAAVLAGLDQRATIRRRAVLALAAFEGRDVEAALTKALDDRDWQVRQAAEDLLGVDQSPQ
ncbi:MAG: HEAT repeat domain-containing protein [Acidimicrobiales bacterium]|nr:HEAT repeat domain-containing protein [Acidimicrobiales bacterium]